tara:strand:+ start:13864 stop:16668 length:2805 start_codon:yes stop_codon:yes gene_type:complete
MYRFFYFVILLLSISFCLNAQERPPIEIYSPKMYGAENQNWGISQSKEKYIYVANNRGLLEFNGAIWKLYASPNETIMRSVSVIDNLIYTGCYSEFGFWRNNELGSLTYTSLSQALNISFLEDEEIWNIITIDEWILFQSLKRIYIYNKRDGTYSIINSETTIYKIFKVNETIYFEKQKDGIYKIENGKAVLVTDDVVIKENLLVNIFDQDGKLLIETEDKGFFVLDSGSLQKWDIPANTILSGVSVYRSIKLRDNSFMLGTISDGIIHLLPNGEVDYQINQNNGLGNNTVQSVFEDIENNIWLGLNNGINCINIKSPFQVYNNNDGKIGTVYASSIFDGNLYLGTNQGLFVKPLESKNNFKFIEGTQGQVWCLVQYDNKLFCGHNAGTFIIENDKAHLISDVQGTWNIIQVENNPNKLLQGNYDGLYVLEKENESWKLKNKISGFGTSSKFFEFLDNQNILVSHEYKGVFKIKVDQQLTTAVSVVKDSTIDKGLNSSLVKYNQHVYYAFKEGVYKYDLQKTAFTRDAFSSKLFSREDYISGKLVVDNTTNRLWGFSSKNLTYVAPGKFSKDPKVFRISYSEGLPRGLTGYENIKYLDNQRFLLGTSSGYLVVDLDKIHDIPYHIKINSVVTNKLDSEPMNIDYSVSGVFNNEENNIEFNYSVAEFDKYLDTEYQYQLVGIDNQWSHWSNESSTLFKYLPFGEYVFNVRAKVGNNFTDNMASYSFEIKRPWFFSNTMITVYIIALWLFSFIIHNIYKQYYKRQREKLLLNAEQELELKELENQSQLMKFNNDKLRHDIESKNRELGISTMSLIKKNEFLNTIKKELKKAEGLSHVKQVVKIIDKNLNNTDDWNLFEEAFNNVDKNFLKKIKTEHPSLTSNDLRLCAYLRLNLSSKEIAPLLNISSRSVEVKRYRLRKKLELSHDVSLTDYLLEV